MMSPDYEVNIESHISDEIQEVIKILDSGVYKNGRVKAIVKTKLQEALLFSCEIDNTEF